MKIKDLLVELEQTPFGSVGIAQSAPQQASGPEAAQSQSNSKIDTAAWVRAFKRVEQLGVQPSSDYEWAIKFKLAGIEPEQVMNNATSEKYRRLGYRADPANVNRLLSIAPSITDLEKLSLDKVQGDAVANLQHDLNIQQLIQQSELDKVDTQALLQMDLAARQAIKQRQQEMELEAKERLAKIEIDIRQSKENDKQREFELEKAKTNHDREVEVIRLTAEGEYKKAKLEADYQLHIKNLENIDNAQERKSKLDVINAEKQKELDTINAQTNAKISELSAETDAKREESDIRIHEAFMMGFKDVWTKLLDKASDTGKTLGQNISAVIGLLGRLSKPVMPKSQQPVESIAYFRNLVAEMDTPVDAPVSKDVELSKKDWDAKFKNDPEIKIVNPLRMMPKDGSYFNLATRDGQAVGVSKGSMLGRSALGQEIHIVFAAPKSVEQVLKDLDLGRFGASDTASTPSVPPVNPNMGRLRDRPQQTPSAGRVLRQPMALRK